MLVDDEEAVMYFKTCVVTQWTLITGGTFNRSAVVEFQSTNDVLTIRQTFTGLDAQGHMRIATFLDGHVPDIAEDAQVEVDDYYEEYHRISPG